MAKIKIDSALFTRAKNVVEAAGYSSLDEFVTHIIEKEVTKYEQTNADEKTAEQLRGLGYIE
jgi:metal-responsive CopG/Arc/MetJ family transcriptional regulator